MAKLQQGLGLSPEMLEQMKQLNEAK